MRTLLSTVFVLLSISPAWASCQDDCRIDHALAAQTISLAVDGRATSDARFIYAVDLGSMDDPNRLLKNRKSLEASLLGQEDCSGVCISFRALQKTGLIEGIHYRQRNSRVRAEVIWTGAGSLALRKFRKSDDGTAISVFLGVQRFDRIVRSFDGTMAGVPSSRVEFSYEVIKTPWGLAIEGKKIGLAFGLVTIDPETYFGRKRGVAEFLKASDGWVLTSLRMDQR